MHKVLTAFITEGKNWFIGINHLSVPEEGNIREKDFRYQTSRSSGPGGQHVNKTESAVRVTHIPSGISVTASEDRSQFRNKKTAFMRILLKLATWEKEQAAQVFQQNWQNHNELERGNPVKTIKEEMRR
ncbi:MAG: hypothetical protein LUG18_12190 [Candidatus Azobacteroides sp.]|nr:hypothetical protein [Candidatus Azobacteroides sp.]